MKKAITGLVIGDIHLGHNVNHTIDILDNLQDFFKKNFKLISKCNFIFLNGDTFDRHLPNNSKEYDIIIGWLLELVKFCSEFNIKLRILEGTPTHDWQQCKVLSTIIAKSNIAIDYKYINTIYIEKNTEYDINILYVPDEYKATSEETYEDIIQLMKDNQLTTVDIAMMHGSFKYQLPITLASAHDENNYLNIVNYYIFINHVHNHSTYKRIVAPGSFDRLTHAEENDTKGGIYFTIDNNKPSYIFLKNTKAKEFYTYDLSKIIDIEELILEIEKSITTKKLGSCIKILVNEKTNITKSIKSIRDKYKLYNIKIEKVDTKKHREGEVITNYTVPLESFNITPTNIAELLNKEMEKHNLTNIELQIMNTELHRILDNNI